MKEETDDLIPSLVEFHRMQKGGCLVLFLSILPPRSFKRVRLLEELAKKLEFTSKEVTELVLHSTILAQGSQSLDESIQKIESFYTDLLENGTRGNNKAKTLEIDSACAWWAVNRI